MTIAIPADELTLAQLACAKLTGIVQGTISIGLSAVANGIPDPRIFLKDQFRVMTGFALVLHTVSGKPGFQHEIQRLRDRSREILNGLEILEGRLTECLDSAETPRKFQLAKNAASDLCNAVGAYGDLINVDRSRIKKAKEVVFQVFEGIDNMVAEPSSR